MILREVALTFVLFALVACASQRKLSLLKSREPAAVRSSEAFSPLRDKVSQLYVFAKSCPAEVTELLPMLANERISFPPCPENFEAHFREVASALRSEERVKIEELIGSQCRTSSSTIGSSPLDSLIEGIVQIPPPSGRDREENVNVISEAEMRLRMRLRDGLLSVRAVHEPLLHWMRFHGEFVISDDELLFFDRLVNLGQCLMNDQEIDYSYRTLHSLETLVRLHAPAEPQRKRIERFLSGVHRLIDRKIGEYFRR